MEASSGAIAPPGEHRQLARKLALRDAVFIGLGAMIGAGIFSATAPAAGAAGSWLLISLAIAAGVAFCNALSSAQLAAIYPAAGGTYVYGRRRLGHFWGYLAGWGFVIGKVASCAAMALTFGFYVNEDFARVLAVAAVIALTTVNVLGVEKTARLATVLVVAVLVTLTLPVISTFGLTEFDIGNALPHGGPPPGLGLLEGSAFLFFAFAGYARIATLGEEVVSPERTIPRAIPVALGLALLVYALVIGAALIALGPDGLAASAAPVADTVDAGHLSALTPVVRIGAALGSLSVLLSLLAGVSRTTLAMARERDLPGWLDAVHPRYRVPHRAELVIGAVVAILVATLDLRSAIAFSSFAVLFYYTVANASAWTLSGPERRWPRWVAGLGIAGCISLAISLPLSTLLSGVALLALGSAFFLFGSRIYASIDAVVSALQRERPDISTHAAPDGIVAIMFGDIEGSTPLNQRLGDEQYAALLKEYVLLIQSNVESCDGHVVKHIGDGFMAAFPRPSDALACALAIQNAVTTASFAEPVRVRIGLHAGSPVREGTDFFGVDVTLASRITDLAAGGEILVSASLRELVESSVGGVFARSREVELKGLTGTHTICAVRGK